MILADCPDQLNIPAMEKTIEKPSLAHDEYADDVGPADMTVEVKYDNGQLRDLLYSPYVFGAALLASFGGFSFGYGMLDTVLRPGLDLHPLTELILSPRSRCHFPHPGNASVPAAIPRDLS